MRGATTHGLLLSPAGSRDSQSSQGTPHTFIHVGCRPVWQLSQPATHSEQINPGEAGSPQNNPEQPRHSPECAQAGAVPGPRHQELLGGLAASSSPPPSPPCPPPTCPTHLQQREEWDLGIAGMRNWEQWERVWCLCWFLHPSAGQPAQSLRNVAGTAGRRPAGKGIKPQHVFKMKVPGNKQLL